jgi:membrane-associated protein
LPRAAIALREPRWRRSARVGSTSLVQAIGYAGIFAILFAETGVLIGFFLPGDTLLISAGILAARGQLSIPVLLVGGSIAAVLGDALGYTIGREAGPRLFQRDDSFWFRRNHLERAELFFARHGGKTIFLARFIVAIRTFAPVVAGAARMPYPRFAVFNVAGGIGWVCLVTLAAYAFGSAVAALDNFIFIATLIILPIPLILAIVQYLRLRRTRKHGASAGKDASSQHPTRRI